MPFPRYSGSPDIGAAYASAGQQLTVETSGLENPWYTLFGSLHLPSGKGLYTVHQRKRAEELLEHLRLLIDLDPHGFWFVVLDNASAHTTPAVLSFATQHQDRLELVYSPTYSPHLNLIEWLWRLMRSQVTRNRFDKTLNAVTTACWNGFVLCLSLNSVHPWASMKPRCHLLLNFFHNDLEEASTVNNSIITGIFRNFN